MRNVVFALLLFFSATILNAQEPISGVWDTTKENTLVEISNNEGKVVSSNKLETGKALLKDIVNLNGKWEAKLYNIKKKKWYNAILKREGEQLSITVKAGLVSKTVYWTKP